MSGISNKILEKFANSVPWKTVAEKAVNATKGQRLWPSNTARNNQKHNFRLDKGDSVDGKHEIILQANKEAENPGVRKAAQKDSHAILGSVTVDPEADPEAAHAKGDLVSSFKSRKS